MRSGAAVVDAAGAVGAATRNLLPRLPSCHRS